MSQFSGYIELNDYLDNDQLTLWEEFIEERHEKDDGDNCPGYWCQWEVDIDRIKWDGQEKFYYHEEWMQYMLDKFIIPWGLIANGTIDYIGDEAGDVSTLTVKDNVITVRKKGEDDIKLVSAAVYLSYVTAEVMVNGKLYKLKNEDGKQTCKEVKNA